MAQHRILALPEKPAHRAAIGGALALACALLSGCATLSQQECQQLNPAKLGLADGRQGYGLWRLDKHQASCARFHLGFDRQAYLAAREQGLLQYCTPENAAQVGALGLSYEGVCPPALEPAFLQSYRRAQYLYRDNGGDSLIWRPFILHH
jgi:hypothetical protein